jgi:adenylosuccinate lyase
MFGGLAESIQCGGIKHASYTITKILSIWREIKKKAHTNREVQCTSASHGVRAQITIGFSLH